MPGYYMQYLEGLCTRRNWHNPKYDCYRTKTGYTCLVLVNGREYQTDFEYTAPELAQENAAMRAYSVCRDFSQNGGMLARNGVVQGLPASEGRSRHRRGTREDRSHHRSSRHSPALSNSSSYGSSD